MKNNTIWINVTTSRNWTRPAVGIVRVERELMAGLQEKFPQNTVKLCVWQDGGFVSVDDEIPAPEQGVRIQTVQHNPPALSMSVMPKRQAVIAIAQGIHSLLPHKARPAYLASLARVKPFAKRMAGKLHAMRTHKKIRTVASADASRASTLSLPGVRGPSCSHPFQAGDILISVGLDWDWPFYKEFFWLRKNDGVKVVTCCYDLIPVLYPQYCVADVANLFSSYFLEIADGSDLIVCISKQTERDLLQMLDDVGGPKVKTHVFPLGDNVPGQGGAISPEVASLLEQPFILFVSSIERRKNHEVIYRAYHLLCKAGLSDKLPKVVFVGMQGWGVGDLMKDIELDPLTRGKIVRLNHVNDEELQSLYKASLFCVFPSLYEGWGLPVGEALSLGKVVVASDRGSLPEVGGDLVIYEDPWNATAWAEIIKKLVFDASFRLEQENKIKSNYARRTWSDSVNSVAEALNGL